MSLARVDIGFSRKKPLGILPFKGEELNLVAPAQTPVKECGIVGNTTSKRVGGPNHTNLHGSQKRFLKI